MKLRKRGYRRKSSSVNHIPAGEFKKLLLQGRITSNKMQNDVENILDGLEIKRAKTDRPQISDDTLEMTGSGSDGVDIFFMIQVWGRNEMQWILNLSMYPNYSEGVEHYTSISKFKKNPGAEYKKAISKIENLAYDKLSQG